jgi:hypothetical protein
MIAERVTVMTQCHILVGGVALGFRLSCLAMVEVSRPVHVNGRAARSLP